MKLKMQTWNSLACQSKGYGTQVTFKACGLQSCCINLYGLNSFCFLFGFQAFLILYGLMEKGFPVFHHYGYWLPFYMGWILFPSTALSFVVNKTINKYILYLASYFNLIYSLDSWTLGHFFVVALFVRKTCTLYDMVLKRHKIWTRPILKYIQLYISVPVRI